MAALVRVGKILLYLCLAALTVSMVIGIGSEETGPLEKAVLAAVIAGCVVVTAKVTPVLSALENRLRDR
jgi:hypothetical protein